MNPTVWTSFSDAEGLTGFAVLLARQPLAVFLVKVTLMLAIGWALHFSLARLRPHRRVVLWRVVLLGLLALPVSSALVPAFDLPVLRSRPAIDLSLVPLPRVEDVTSARVHSLPDVVSQPAIIPPHTMSDSLAAMLAALSRNALPLLAVLWISGVIIMALRFVRGVRAVRRLVRATHEPDASLVKIFSSVKHNLGVASPVGLRVSDAIDSPMLCALPRPVILLPERITRADYAEDLPAIFAHELAHVRSRDLGWLTLIQFIQALLWFHPLVWALRRVYANACEQVCDAAAARTLRDPAAYSQSLARIALELAGRPALAATLPMAHVSDIRRRLTLVRQGILDAPLTRRARSLVVLLGAALLILVSSIRLTPAGETPQADKKPAVTPQLETRIYKLARKEDGPRIKKLINSIIAQTSDTTLSLERKVITEEYDLIVKDTPENLAKIEELLRDKNFIQKMNNEPLEIRNFSLLPRDVENIKSDQLQDIGKSVVEAIEVLLYEQEGKDQAAKEGRHLYYDPNRLQLTITDTAVRLERVSEYLQSLPDLWQTRREVIFLEHAKAAELAPLLNALFGPQPNAQGDAIVFRRRRSEEIEWKNLRVRVVRIEPNDVKDAKDDSVELSINNGTSVNNLTLQNLSSQYIDDHEITARDVVADTAHVGDGSAEIKIRQVPNAAKNQQNQPNSSKDDLNITIQAHKDLNALIVHYINPARYQELVKKVKELDKPTKEDMSQKPEKKGLEIQNFSLKPRDVKNIRPDQLQAFGKRVVEAIEAFLYAEGGKAQAAKEGRKLYYDPQILQLTVIDTPARIARVAEYIQSLPELGQNTRTEVIFLKYAIATDLATRLNLMFGAQTGWGQSTIVFDLKRGEERPFQNMRTRVTRVEANDPKDPGDDTAEIKITTADDKTTQMNLQKSAAQWLGEYQFLVERIMPSPTEPHAGSTILRISYNPSAKQRPVLSISPNADINCIIIKHQDPKIFEEIKEQVRLLDKPVKQYTIKSQFIETDMAHAPKPAPGEDASGISNDADLKMKIEDLLAKGLATKTNGPNVSSLEGQTGEFRIEKYTQAFGNNASGPKPDPAEAIIFKITLDQNDMNDKGIIHSKGTASWSMAEDEQKQQSRQLMVTQWDRTIKDGETIILRLELGDTVYYALLVTTLAK